MNGFIAAFKTSAGFDTSHLWGDTTSPRGRRSKDEIWKLFSEKRLIHIWVFLWSSLRFAVIFLVLHPSPLLLLLPCSLPVSLLLMEEENPLKLQPPSSFSLTQPAVSLFSRVSLFRSPRRTASRGYRVFLWHRLEDLPNETMWFSSILAEKECTVLSFFFYCRLVRKPVASLKADHSIHFAPKKTIFGSIFFQFLWTYLYLNVDHLNWGFKLLLELTVQGNSKKYGLTKHIHVL